MDDQHVPSPLEPVPEIERTCSRSNTNSTVDELPGPGRLLGNLYDYLGLRLEVLLGKAAMKMGKGPTVTAERILKSRVDLLSMHTTSHKDRCDCFECALVKRSGSRQDRHEHNPPTNSPKNSEKRMNRDAKRLIGYVNSGEHSTQKQTVEAILDLSIRDSELRDLLKNKGASKVISDLVRVNAAFRSKNREADLALLSRSRKVLVYLESSRFFSLLENFKRYTIQKQLGLDYSLDMAKSLWNPVSGYLWSTEHAFLVVRVLRSMCLVAIEHWYWNVFDRQLLRAEANKFALVTFETIKEAPDYFEWSECEELLYTVFHSFGHDFTFSLLSSIIDWLLQNSPHLHRVFEADGLRKLRMDINQIPPHEFVEYHRILDAMRAGLRRSHDQELSPRALENIYMYKQLHHLRGLTCPVIEAVCKFVTIYEHDSLLFQNAPTVAEKELYDTLADFIFASDPQIQAKAWEYMTYFMKQDIYRCEMMLYTLWEASFDPPEGLAAFKLAMRENCTPELSSDERNCTLYRHCDSSGHTHYHDEPKVHCLCNNIVRTDMIEYQSDWTLDINLHYGEAINRAQYHPLVVENSQSGEISYVAKARRHIYCCDNAGGPLELCFVIKDGTRREDLRIEMQCPHGKFLSSDTSVVIPVLRYSPEAYASALGSAAQGAPTTEPFSWKQVQLQAEKNRDYGECQWSVITIEEARARGYSRKEIYFKWKPEQWTPFLQCTEYLEALRIGPRANPTLMTDYEEYLDGLCNLFSAVSDPDGTHNAL